MVKRAPDGEMSVIVSVRDAAVAEKVRSVVRSTTSGRVTDGDDAVSWNASSAAAYALCACAAFAIDMTKRTDDNSLIRMASPVRIIRDDVSKDHRREIGRFDRRVVCAARSEVSAERRDGAVGGDENVVLGEVAADIDVDERERDVAPHMNGLRSERDLHRQLVANDSPADARQGGRERQLGGLVRIERTIAVEVRIAAVGVDANAAGNGAVTEIEDDR